MATKERRHSVTRAGASKHVCRACSKRLPPKQVAMLKRLDRYSDYIYVTGLPTLRALHFMALAEQRPGFGYEWRITHKGVACLKQNGHYPIYIDLASVRDPRKRITGPAQLSGDAGPVIATDPLDKRIDGRATAIAKRAANQHCADCGKPYGGRFWVDTVLTPEQWGLIAKGDEILCANCIVLRAKILPGFQVMHARLVFVTDPPEVKHRFPTESL